MPDSTKKSLPIKNNKVLPISVTRYGTFRPSDVWLEHKKNSIVVTTPAQNQQADTMRGLWEGIVIGIVLPFWTRPLDKLQVNVSTMPHKFSWSASLSVLREQPYKGVGTRVITNTFRCCTIFYTTPLAHNYLLDAGCDLSTSEKLSPALAGTLNGFLMAPYTVMDQYRMQAGATGSWKDIWNKLPRQDFFRALPAAMRTGIALDTLFWPTYTSIVKRVEKQLRVNKQNDSLSKLSEELLIGALGGALTVPFTFPLYALQLRLIKNPGRTLRTDFQAGWESYDRKIISEHYYRGFITGLTRMMLAMGMVNGLKYSSNIVYDREMKSVLTHPETTLAGRFFQSKPVVSVSEEDDLVFLNKLGTC